MEASQRLETDAKTITTTHPLTGFRVLVLNASYQPLKIVSWQRAILLYLADKVEVIDLYKVHVRSPSRAIELPCVIRMRKWVTPKKVSRSVRFSRYHVFLRDDFTCQYCLEEFPTKDLTLDHVNPVMKGGKKTWNNIVTCCVECNQVKGSRTPTEAGFHQFKMPREPKTGFLPDLLYYKDGLPDAWKPYFEIFNPKSA